MLPENNYLPTYGILNQDYSRAPFYKGSYFSNGYQPNKIGLKSLKEVYWDDGLNNRSSDPYLRVKDTGLKGSTNTAGKNMDDQKVWTDGSHYYVWVGNGGTGGYYVNIGDTGSIGTAALINNAVDYRPVDFKNVDTSSIKNKDNYQIEGVLPLPNEATNGKLTLPVPPNSYYAAQEINKNKIDNADNINTKTNTGGTGNAANTPAPQYTDLSGLYDIIKNLSQRIYDLDHPYIPTAEELAERYGYTNDIDENWLLNNLYNPKTNEYYKNALDYFDKVRTETTSDALAYERNQLQDYLNSYNYQAPTGANRSIKAANVMRNQLGGNQTMSDLDSQLLDQYNNIQDAYKAELASNPYQAKSHANSLRTWLANNSATINASNVKQYVAELDAYADMYAAGRELGNYINKANATKYSGLVNAQSTNAKAAADGYASNAFDRMYNWYNVINNGNKALTNSEISKEFYR